MQTSTTCQACHAALREQDRFCWTCGQPRDAEPAPPAPRHLRTVTSRPPRPGRPSRAQAWGVIVPVVLLLLAAVAVAVWWLQRPSDAAARTLAPAPAATPAGSVTPAPTAAAPVGAPAAAPSPLFPTGVLPVASASAPGTSPDSVDAGGARTSYAAANLLDGDASTAWRTEGDATGSTLSFAFDAPVRITEVGLVNGFAKVDPHDGTDRYGQGRRVLAVTWTFGDGTRVRQDLTDGVRSVQSTSVAPVETSTVTLTIEAVTAPGAGGRFDRTALSEVRFANR